MTELLPHRPLTEPWIDRSVRTQIGVFVLGYVTPDNSFHIQFVGRSDDDLHAELKRHIGEYKDFRCAYFDSAEQAFAAECELWHIYGHPGYNPYHPEAPRGSAMACPIEHETSAAAS